MRSNVRDALASQFDSYGIVRKLHDVPPHEVYEVTVDGRRAVYKGDTGPTGSAATEGHVTAFVGQQTTVSVPAILFVGDDHYVAAWHPDAPVPDREPAADQAWAAAAGRGLATLHDETGPVVDQHGQFRSHEDGVTVAGHDDWHAAALKYVDRHRSVLAEYGHADVADAVADFLIDRPDAFDGAGGPVCCHGWATPEHVTVSEGEVACVVDFEHAIAAPPEFDVWRTVLPTFDLDAATGRSFREGYESVRPLRPGFERRKPLYLLLNGIYYVESLYVQDQHGPEATAERAQRLRDRVLGTLDRLE